MWVDGVIIGIRMSLYSRSTSMRILLFPRLIYHYAPLLSGHADRLQRSPCGLAWEHATADIKRKTPSFIYFYISKENLQVFRCPVYKYGCTKNSWFDYEQTFDIIPYPKFLFDICFHNKKLFIIKSLKSLRAII